MNESGGKRLGAGKAMESNDEKTGPMSREILRDFPELREKTVVDVVNNLEVVGDHLRRRDENPGSVVSRVWNLMTGESLRRQQALDRGVEGTIKGMSEWLRALQAAAIESDIAIARVAERLLETRQFVMGLEERHQALRKEVESLRLQLDTHVEHTNQQLSKLRKDLSLEKAGRRAWNAVDQVEARWVRGRFDAFPPLLRTVLAANSLYWGDFGAFLRLNGTDESEARKLGEYARDKLAKLAGGFRVTDQRNGAILIKQQLASLENMSLSADRRSAAAYLLDGSVRDVQPLTTAVATRLRDATAPLPDNVVTVMLPPHMGEVAVREVVCRIEYEAGDKERSPR